MRRWHCVAPNPLGCAKPSARRSPCMVKARVPRSSQQARRRFIPEQVGPTRRPITAVGWPLGRAGSRRYAGHAAGPCWWRDWAWPPGGGRRWRGGSPLRYSLQTVTILLRETPCGGAASECIVLPRQRRAQLTSLTRPRLAVSVRRGPTSLRRQAACEASAPRNHRTFGRSTVTQSTAHVVAMPSSFFFFLPCLI